MFIVYKSPVDNLPRARKVESYREAGQVMAALDMMGVDPKAMDLDEIMAPPITSLPIIVDQKVSPIIWSRTHIPQELDITI